MPKSRLLSPSNTAARLAGYAAATGLLSLSHKEAQKAVREEGLLVGRGR